jgi:hypothetical protein
MATAKSHHVIYGTLECYLTGEELTDTDDERIRQQLLRMLVEDKGYRQLELTPRLRIETFFAKSYVVSLIEVTITVAGRQLLLLRYGPGSLVSRERSAVAAARVLNPAYRIPYAVVTNGRDAEFLETATGKVLGFGVESIPDREESLSLVKHASFLPPPSGLVRERELRILNAFDVERCCL